MSRVFKNGADYTKLDEEWQKCKNEDCDDETCCVCPLCEESSSCGDEHCSSQLYIEEMIEELNNSIDASFTKTDKYNSAYDGYVMTKCFCGNQELDFNDLEEDYIEMKKMYNNKEMIAEIINKLEL